MSPEEKLRCNIQEGISLFQQGYLEDALGKHIESCKIAKNMKNISGNTLCILYANTGIINYRLRKIEKSLEYINRGIELSDGEQKNFLLNEKGIILAKIGEYDKANETFLDALSSAKKSTESYRIINETLDKLEEKGLKVL